MIQKWNLEEQFDKLKHKKPMNPNISNTSIYELPKTEADPKVEESEELPKTEADPKVEESEELEISDKYIGLNNDTNKCWANSILIILYYCKNIRDAILDIINDQNYKTILEEKLQIINSKYASKEGEGNANTYDPEKDVDFTLIIPALYNIIKGLNDLDNSNGNKIYSKNREHFIFVENGNFADAEEPYSYEIFGLPESILSQIILNNHDNLVWHHPEMIEIRKKPLPHNQLEAFGNTFNEIKINLNKRQNDELEDFYTNKYEAHKSFNNFDSIEYNTFLETKKQELKNINEKHESLNELLLNEYNIKKNEIYKFSNVYKNNIQQLFGFRKVELIELLDSDLKVFHRFYNNIFDKRSILNKYTDEAQEGLIDDAFLIHTETQSVENIFYLKNYYKNKYNTSESTYEDFKKSQNFINDFTSKFDIENYLNELWFNKYDFYNMEKNIKYGGNPNFYKCNQHNIISNESNKHIVKTIEKSSDDFTILSRQKKLYINLPQYFMVKMGNTRPTFSSIYPYENITLPLLNPENIEVPKMIKYNIKAIILHNTNVHFTSIVKINDLWVHFDDSSPRKELSLDEVENKIMTLGQYFIYEQESNQDIDNNMLELSDTMLIKELNNLLIDSYEEVLDKNITILTILDTIDTLIVTQLNKNNINIPITHGLYNFISRIYKYIVLVTIICKLNNESYDLSNIIAYCLSYLYDDIKLKTEKIKFQFGIVHKIISNSLTKELINNIFSKIDLLLPPSKNDKIEFLLEFEISNSIRMNKYRSNIEKLCKSNASDLFSDYKPESKMSPKSEIIAKHSTITASKLLNQITKPNISLEQTILADETDVSSPLSEPKNIVIDTSSKKLVDEGVKQAENTEQTEEAENTEQSVQAENTEQTEEAENIEQTEEAENIEQAEEAENIEQTEEAENIEQAEEAENIEQAEEAENIEQTEEAENIEQTEEAENIEQTKKLAEEAEQTKKLAEEAEQAKKLAENIEQTEEAENIEQTKKLAEEAEQTKKLAEEAEQTKKLAEEAEQAKKLAEEAEQTKKLAEEAEQAEQAKKLAEEAEQAKKLAEEAEQAKKLAEEAEQAKKLAEEAEQAEQAKKLAEEAEQAKKLAEEAEQAKKLAEVKQNIENNIIDIEESDNSKKLKKIILSYGLFDPNLENKPIWVLGMSEWISSIFVSKILSETDIIELLEFYKKNREKKHTIRIQKNEKDWIKTLFKIFLFRMIYINNDIFKNSKDDYEKIFGKEKKTLRYYLEKHNVFNIKIHLGNDDYEIKISCALINDDLQLTLILEEDDDSDDDSDDDDSDDDNSISGGYISDSSDSLSSDSLSSDSLSSDSLSSDSLSSDSLSSDSLSSDSLSSESFESLSSESLEYDKITTETY